ncbi:carboxymuconolactone decarboxylase family protein [Natrinema salifodinae]|uniref:Alkylhydroperoxidase AhpD family core domain-containing protein n=1 Tax=Natrinema salifodinae TaxID=1202768 RepID=A0A1I0Q6E4_9EURY|nr:carboxymuconolactone decarboxylase family protein [Natrinema salifodinae]SEW22525.1 alkylhydroperoxidase AhpD family core domain-containing protein [Natrinema salifodinae]
MVTTETRAEIEEYLGRVPSWITALPEPAAEHGWEMVRDLQLAETELTTREKSLVGLGAAAAMQCPYCIRFHKAEAELEEVTDDEMAEAVAVAGDVRYFSTILHGAEVEFEEFADETADIVDHVERQRAAVSGDD